MSKSVRWMPGRATLAILVVALLVAACMDGPPLPAGSSLAPTVAPTESAAETPTEIAETEEVTTTEEITATEEATGEVGASEEMTATESMSETMPTESATELSGVLTGTVTYRQRIALPPGSVVEVQLLDVSRMDVAADVLDTQTITTTGENVPIPFTLNYDPAQIDPAMSYAIGARITVDGTLRWINTQQFPVLTRGAPLTAVEVVVQPAQ